MQHDKQMRDKMRVYYDNNIKKYVKILQADNIHERNIKGAHLQHRE